jgi:hypothetical protein
MARRAARTRRGPTGDEAGSGCEWIGGLLATPFFIGDREEPYRALVAVWLERPSELCVGQRMLAPEDAGGAVGRALVAALERPLAGAPRRPDRIRVADATLAAEVRQAIGEAIPVVVAPTPELDAFLAEMAEAIAGGDEDASYLAGGRIPPEAVAQLFASARALHALAPWRVMTDDQVLRLDIPALGVEGACVSVIGQLGQSRGILIFPSLVGYDALLRCAEAPRQSDRPADFGTDLLALELERGADIPPSMRREIAAYGWPIDAADAYPRVTRRERDGASRPLVERDVRIASVCAASLAAFFVKHRRELAARRHEPICESWFGDDDVELRFTIPYEALADFDVPQASAPAPVARARVGRNDPCPCGSGKKYKKCHLAEDEAARPAQAGPHPGHALDERMVREVVGYALTRFGERAMNFERDFEDVDEALQLAMPWLAYQQRIRGRTAADWYLEQHARRLSRTERAWLEAQRAAWLSVWEVTGVEPGGSIELRDLLTGETRRVREATASKCVALRDALLARVIDWEGVSLLCGMHPRVLPPAGAAAVARRARGKLRAKGVPPHERLRDEAVGRHLIRSWEREVAACEAAAAAPLDLRNGDGDPFLPTTDHFALAPGERARVAAALAGLDGVDPPEPGEGPAVYTFLRGHTVIGQARLSAKGLRVETNSCERADALRARMEAACGDALRHRAREHADPLSSEAEVRPGPGAAPPPEARAAVRAFKEQHYATWPDEPLPALRGKTPRQAVRTARGREAVDLLLRDMENLEQRGADDGTAYDFSRLRRELGLD